MAQMPGVPDYTGLAYQQAGLNQGAANAVNRANRADQHGPAGSLTWVNDPTGGWTQRTTLNDQSQYNYDAMNSMQGGLINQINSGEGLAGWGDPNITRGVSAMPDGGYAASQQVIDATRALQQPTLDKNRDAERARAAAMGITLGSAADNDIERNIGTNYNDADLKAILAGTTEAGNVFNRQLATRQQGVDENVKASNMSSAVRQGQQAERMGILQGYQGLKNDIGNPQFASYSTAVGAAAPQIYGAANDAYTAGMGRYNAETARAEIASADRARLLQAGVGAAGGLGGLMGLFGAGAKGVAGLFGGEEDTLGDYIGENSDNWADYDFSDTGGDYTSDDYGQFF